MNGLIQSLKELSPAKLAALIGTGVVLLGFFIFLSTRLATPSMAPLYSGLDMEDSSQIVEELEQSAVPYELRANGSQILVPSDQVLRLRDAGQGRFIGTMSDSLGQTAQLNLQLNGLAFTATEIYPHTTIAGRGRLAADGQSYTSATAAGCKVQARRR